MLDKLSRKILKHMRDNPNATKNNFHDGIYTIAQTLSSEPETIRAAISFLKEKGFIEYIYSGRNTLLGFKLTHAGLHCDEFEHLEAMEKWKERIIGVIGTLVVEILVMGITYGIGILSTVLSQGG